VGSGDVGVTDNTKRRRLECKKSPANPVEDEANGRSGAITKKQRRFEEEEVQAHGSVDILVETGS